MAVLLSRLELVQKLGFAPGRLALLVVLSEQAESLIVSPGEALNQSTRDGERLRVSPGTGNRAGDLAEIRPRTLEY
jgi:hypothetical protein